MSQLNSSDRLWYGLGGAFALMIVVLLFFNSIGRVHPLQHTADSLNQAQGRADEALSAGREAMDDANKMKSKVDSIVEDSMKEYRNR